VKKRCSTMWCPWKARHYFNGGYRECWFHYREMPLLNWAWDLFNYPARKLFNWIRFRLCGIFPKGAITYWMHWKVLLIPRLYDKYEEE